MNNRSTAATLKQLYPELQYRGVYPEKLFKPFSKFEALYLTHSNTPLENISFDQLCDMWASLIDYKYNPESHMYRRNEEGEYVHRRNEKGEMEYEADAYLLNILRDVILFKLNTSAEIQIFGQFVKTLDQSNTQIDMMPSIVFNIKQQLVLKGQLKCIEIRQQENGISLPNLNRSICDIVELPSYELASREHRPSVLTPVSKLTWQDLYHLMMIYSQGILQSTQSDNCKNDLLNCMAIALVNVLPSINSSDWQSLGCLMDKVEKNPDYIANENMQRFVLEAELRMIDLISELNANAKEQKARLAS